MNNTVTPNDWLSSGGAYWIIFGLTVVIAIAFAIFSIRLSARTRLENDGCLMAIASVILTLAGAGVGFWIGKYPTFVISSLIGAVLFPTIGMWIWLRTISKKG